MDPSSQMNNCTACGQRIAPFTASELRVIDGVLRGLSNREIGQELGLVRHTVKLYLRSVFGKTQTRSRRTLAVAWNSELFQIGLHELGLLPQCQPSN